MYVCTNIHIHIHDVHLHIHPHIYTGIYIYFIIYTEMATSICVCCKWQPSIHTMPFYEKNQTENGRPGDFP